MDPIVLRLAGGLIGSSLNGIGCGSDRAEVAGGLVSFLVGSAGQLTVTRMVLIIREEVGS